VSTQRQRDRLRKPSRNPDFVPVSSLAAPVLPVANPCGAIKTISGAKPLRCTLAAGHTGDHGVHYAGALLIRWSQ